MEETDHQSVWELRAQLISEECHPLVQEITLSAFEDMFRKPNSICLLQKLFSHATACGHTPGPGHLLCHLQMCARSTVSISGHFNFFGGIRCRKLKTWPITAALVAESAAELVLALPPGLYEKECMVQLWNHLQCFKSKQSSMLSLLLDLPIFPLKAPYNYDVQVGTISVTLNAIEEALKLEYEVESIPVLLPLSKTIITLSKGLYADPNRPEEQHTVQELERHCRRISNIAMQLLSTTTIFGKQNLRSLACTRSTHGTHPATGWKQMYMD